jgi:hypothetical protein
MFKQLQPNYLPRGISFCTTHNLLRWWRLFLRLIFNRIIFVEVTVWPHIYQKKRKPFACNWSHCTSLEAGGLAFDSVRLGIVKDASHVCRSNIIRPMDISTQKWGKRQSVYVLPLFNISCETVQFIHGAIQCKHNYSRWLRLHLFTV